MAKPQKKQETIDIMTITRGQIMCCVKGTTPLLCNRLSEKAKRELLLPAKKKNAAEKAGSLKHNPREEFRASPYTTKNDSDRTLITMPSTTFKGALRSAALDIPGIGKSQIGRLTYVNGDYVAIYGVPKMHMSMVRQAGMNKTPDVRSRAVLPEWAAFVGITYTKPILTEKAVLNLFAAAGVIMGVGDWRPEKGSGNYGTFELVNADDKDFVRIVTEGGREAQIAAMKRAEPYDGESAELLTWFDDEVDRRGLAVV